MSETALMKGSSSPMARQRRTDQSIRRLPPGAHHPQQLMQQPNMNHVPLISLQQNSLTPIPLTREMFFEAYGRGKWNLSVVPRPECLTGTTLLKAPEAYYEIKRLKCVESYDSLPHWNNDVRFNALLQKAKEMFSCKGASVSLIGSKFQNVKHEINLGFKKCARSISLDAHAVLSSRFFAMLDASTDWRTETNPLIVGPPDIRYYVGVPLLTPSKEAIGIFAIFDSFPRSKLEEETVTIMKQMAAEIMEYLDKPTYSNKQMKSNALELTKGKKTNEAVDLILKQYGRATVEI
ncbi:unnamed protein product [Ambrosiozyma monospora]|uniref:Unnamed protein product n=1 Tax=Ambrosiozyma monospora TaxID=43982 RepID=A0ACB5TQS4_AMBMO|nr:unnamed protein product [Ambrosiozyma monospora]